METMMSGQEQKRLSTVMVNGQVAKRVNKELDYIESQQPLLCLQMFEKGECRQHSSGIYKVNCTEKCQKNIQGKYKQFFVTVYNSTTVIPKDAVYSITITTGMAHHNKLCRMASKIPTGQNVFTFSIASTLDEADDTYSAIMKEIVDTKFSVISWYGSFKGKGSFVDYNRGFWQLARKIANPTEKLPAKDNVHFTERTKKQLYDV